MKKLAQLLNGQNAQDQGKLLLRVILAFGMLFHGYGKLMGGAGHIAGMLQEAGIPGFIGYGVIIGEFVAPLMILVGFKSRLGGLAMSFTMVVAILMAHAGEIFSVNDHGSWAIELPAIYLVGGLAIALLGAGKYSVSKGQWD
ncbi:DoxX family protein [Reichenbachiella carrageenanivorans]|uniref:DoxX family protein n=1 Tax=Reichenbachiella carrageenanivorans TaxID=2979869 RepID=A0ABY6D1H8_9BACT|nr:DoxX family protein [Reichenbachiella carrageenanivorans]UXX80006.1 DoxX family protein [Reichenbachiella carrageenanivorans]